MAKKVVKAVGASQPFVDVFPVPLVAQRAPVSSDSDYAIGFKWIYNSQEYTHMGGGTWDVGGTGVATTTEYGSVLLDTDGTLAGATDDTVPTSLAVKTYADSIAIAGAPDASEVTKGIAELANTSEAETGTDDERIMTALKVTQLLDSGNHSASFTTLALSGASTITGAFDVDTTGAISLDADAASNFSVDGAGIDLTLASAGGRVVVNGEEAADDAVRLLSAAGGLDADFALSVNIASSETSADSVVLSSGGGMDLTATGGAGLDIDIANTSGSVNISSGENVANAIVLNASAGGIDITAAGAAGEDIDLSNTAGSIHLVAGEAVSDAVNIDSSGGVDVDAVGQVNIASSQNAADAVVIEASAGGVQILASGASAGEDIVLTATGSSITATATEDAALAIYLHANGGTSETIDIHADQGTGVASINVHSDVGGVTIASGLASADAINLNASDAAGGIDIDAGTAGVIVDSTGAISLDGAAASNFSVSGAGVDLSLVSAGGRVVMNGEEAAADALRLLSAAGGLDVDVALQMSLVSSQNAADAIVMNASAGGIDITAAGAAGEDIDITNTAGSVNISAGEAIASAIVLDASDAAGGIDLTTGGGSIDLSSSGFVTMVPGTVSAAATSATLNTDVGSVTLTGQTTASGAQETFTITNSQVTANSALFVTVTNKGTNDARMTLEQVKPAAGSFEVMTQNNGAAALNGDVIINFWRIA